MQAFLAGSAALILFAPLLELPEPAVAAQRMVLMGALIVHLGWILFENVQAPARREAEFARHSALVTHGPFAGRHWVIGVGLGIAGPVLLLVLGGVFDVHAYTAPMAATLALAGLWVEEDLLVRAGQALPIS